MTIDEFRNSIAVLSAGTGIPIGENRSKVYFSLLKDLPARAFHAAVEKVLCEHKWNTLPQVAEFRQATTEIMQPEQMGLDPMEAFELARKAVRRFGYPDREGGLASLPLLVARVVNQIGWDAFCDSENPEALRAHFTKAFEAARSGDMRRENLPETVRTSIAEVKAIAARTMKTIPAEIIATKPR